MAADRLSNLTREEKAQLSRIGGIINAEGLQKDIVLTLRLKKGLIMAIEERGNAYARANEAYSRENELRKSQIKPDLLTYLRVASGCRVGNERMVAIVNRLIESEDDKTTLLKKLVYKKRYETPEIVPQQFAHEFQDHLPTKFNQSINVFFLLDQMVGYIFQDGTRVYKGDLLKDVIQ